VPGPVASSFEDRDRYLSDVRRGRRLDAEQEKQSKVEGSRLKSQERGPLRIPPRIAVPPWVTFREQTSVISRECRNRYSASGFRSCWSVLRGTKSRYNDAMSHDAAEILKEALALPMEARAALADSLLESVDSEVDEDAEAAWQREIARRAAELDSGSVTPVPWAEVRSRLMATLSK